MSIIEKIDDDLKKALKAGEKEKTTVLRGLKSDIKYRHIDKRDDLTEEDILEVISGATKKIRDSIEQFDKGGRDDLVNKEELALEIVSAYLPEQLGEQELRGVIQQTISEICAESPQQMGMVMKSLMPKIKGRADGKLASKLVTEILAK